MAKMTDSEYQKRVKKLWDRIKRDFATGTIVEIRDKDGRAWPIPVSVLLKINELPSLTHEIAKAMAPPGLANKNTDAVREAQRILRLRGKQKGLER